MFEPKCRTSTSISSEEKNPIIRQESGTLKQEELLYDHIFTKPEEEQQYQQRQRQQLQQQQNQYYRDNIGIPEEPTYSESSQYIELALYIISGIFLIFILEQILHLGLYLR
jgi:hypothetical protein